MKQIKNKFMLLLSLSLLVSSLGFSSFAADKDYPIVYSVAPPLTELLVPPLPVQAEE